MDRVVLQHILQQDYYPIRLTGQVYSSDIDEAQLAGAVKKSRIL
jgi:hypothetical protein